MPKLDHHAVRDIILAATNHLPDRRYDTWLGIGDRGITFHFSAPRAAELASSALTNAGYSVELDFTTVVVLFTEDDRPNTHVNIPGLITGIQEAKADAWNEGVLWALDARGYDADDLDYRTDGKPNREEANPYRTTPTEGATL